MLPLHRTSSKKDRLQRYLAVGDIDLTEDDIASIDQEGAKWSLQWVAAKVMLEVMTFKYRPSLPEHPDTVAKRAVQIMYGGIIVGFGIMGWRLYNGI